ncbi:MAG: 23S rRNA (guanosine(2251)-2'-O)-methyltransferase RlmB [Thermoflavifilum sp.]|nr:23S rRNA (guanosine(2251)-2'-O)-methyltransferase RlmB [Thermoflavifilum sp.]MCL6513566.1 23S rRNA (guanosine(2251)-2'-O)-methyltransferase RlmB [Alicyclobacillus sp.]
MSDDAEVLYGRHPVLEALKAGRPLNKLWLAEGAEGGSLAEILARAREQGVIIQRVPRQRLARLAGENHQGVVAFIAAHEYATLNDVMQRDTGHAPLVVLLDELSDPHNLGAIVRSAEAAGAQGVVVPRRRSVPLTQTVAKAAAGALEYLPVARVPNLVQAMERLKEAGYWVYGADAGAARLYTEVDLRGATAIVIGAEGKGLSRLVKERCDDLVKLPMLGRVGSLNASVAAGVLLYEAVRQRQA